MAAGSLVAAVALIGVVVMGRMLTKGNDGNGAAGSWAARVVHPGDQVSGRGVLVAEPGAPPRLCLPNPVRLRNYEPGSEPAPTCSPISVDLQGADLSLLPGRTERQGVVFAGPVLVRGTWKDGGIEVQSIDSAPPDEPAAPGVPCSKPNGGWGPTPATSLEAEAALARLAAELSASPDQYAGYWTVSLDRAQSSVVNGDEGPFVAVVATVGDAETARSTLGRLYPYALCVTVVPYSSLDLDRVAAVFARSDRTWQSEVVPYLNLVRVRLAVLDEESAWLLRQHPEATAQPMVMKAGV